MATFVPSSPSTRSRQQRCTSTRSAASTRSSFCRNEIGPLRARVGIRSERSQALSLSLSLSLVESRLTSRKNSTTSREPRRFFMNAYVKKVRAGIGACRARRRRPTRARGTTRTRPRAPRRLARRRPRCRRRSRRARAAATIAEAASSPGRPTGTAARALRHSPPRRRLRGISRVTLPRNLVPEDADDEEYFWGRGGGTRKEIRGTQSFFFSFWVSPHSTSSLVWFGFANVT